MYILETKSQQVEDSWPCPFLHSSKQEGRILQECGSTMEEVTAQNESKQMLRAGLEKTMSLFFLPMFLMVQTLKFIHQSISIRLPAGPGLNWADSVSRHRELIHQLGSRDLPGHHPLQACHTSRWFRCRFIIFCLPIKWTAIPWKYSNLQIHSKLLRTNNLTGLETLKHPWGQYGSLFFIL